MEIGGWAGYLVYILVDEWMDGLLYVYQKELMRSESVLQDFGSALLLVMTCDVTEIFSQGW